MSDHLKLPTFTSALPRLCCGVLIASSATVGADSVNWTSTVGEPIASMQHQQFRYDLDLRPVVKRLPTCLECAPASALQLDADERFGQRLRHTYRKFGEDLAARLWDDPKGRRVRFDVDGRPGLGLQIPLD